MGYDEDRKKYNSTRPTCDRLFGYVDDPAGTLKIKSVDEMTVEEKLLMNDVLYSRQLKGLDGVDTKVKSDGWETSYYDIPPTVKDVDDLIVHFKLNWHMANILKACLRYGNKDGTSKGYDLNKIDFMSKRERENIKDE